MASTNIYRTQTTGDTKTWTYSAWLKKGSVGNDQVIFKSYTSGSDYIYLRFNSNNDMYMESAKSVARGIPTRHRPVHVACKDPTTNE